jgi:hypothetical protein
MVGPGRVAAEPAAIGELAQNCGGLPLALRIAGTKLAARPSWPVSAMVRRMAGRGSRMRELESGTNSVRASIASSYDSLTGPARDAFRMLSLLGPSDFAEWVIGALLGRPDAADVTEELVRQSLLTPLGVDDTGEPRYRLHDLLRDFAADQFDAMADPARADGLDRLLAGWLQLTRLAGRQLPAEPHFPPTSSADAPAIVRPHEAKRLTADPTAWFTAERVNLRATIQQACRAGRVDQARQLVSAMSRFHHLQNRHDDASLLWQLIIDSAAEHHESAAVITDRLRLGASMAERGLAADALPLFDQ